MTEAVRQIVNTVSTYDPAADVGLIQRCFDFAAERHSGQRPLYGLLVRGGVFLWVPG